MLDSNQGNSSPPLYSMFILLLIFFLISGACGLIYEIVWQRMLHLVFGTSVYSVATVLTAFMGGLALGSWYFGKKADKSSRPLSLYALLEIGIGISALLIPLMIKAVTVIYIALHRILPQHFTLLTLIKFALCFLILLIPTILMGATLPVASRYIIRNLAVVGGRVGGLYGINTLGAVIGTVAAGFFLIVTLGSNTTTFIAASANIGIGILALILDRTIPSAPIGQYETANHTEHISVREVEEQHSIPRALILLAVGVSGFCALAYEVFWMRTLTFYGWSSIYAFPTMLASFLCGSALGSLFITWFADRRRFTPIFYGILQIVIALAALFTIWEFTAIGDFAYRIWRLAEPGWYSFVRAGFVVAILTIFIPAFLMGMVIPLAVRLYTRKLQKLGSAIGSVYAINTIGAVLGSFFAGFIFIPLIGITVSILIVTALNLVNGTLILMYGPLTRWKWARPLTAVASAMILIVGIVFVPKDRPITFYSPFFRSLERGDQILFYEEGMGGTVSVRQFFPHIYDNGQYKVIEVDGINVAGTSPMIRTTQKIQGHMPLILYKAFARTDPQYAFILGLGTGESSYSITLHSIKRLDCLEIVPAERPANVHFHDINNKIFENPKFNLTIEDARNFLFTTTTRYDVIESDSVHPEVNITTYTKEYFEICRDRLTERGIFSTWIPLFNLTEDNLKIMMKTLHEIFPHIMVWYTPNYQNKHALLMGSKTKLSLDVGMLQEELSKPEISASLAEIGITSAQDLLSTFMFDESAIAEYIETSLVNDDSHMYLPHFLPRQQKTHDLTVHPNLDIFLNLSTPVLSLLEPSEQLDSSFFDTLEKKISARNFLIQGVGNFYDGRLQQATEYYRKAHDLFPDDPVITYMLNESSIRDHLVRASKLLRKGAMNNAIEACQSALTINPDSAEAHTILGMIYFKAAMYDRSLQSYSKVTEIAPDCAEAYYNMARVYYRTGMHDRAKELCEKALEINPYMRKAENLLKNLKKV